MNIFHNIFSPSLLPPTDDKSWKFKENLLKILIYATAIAGTVYLFFRIFSAIQSGVIVLVIMQTLVLLWLLGITFLTKINFSIRVYSLAAVYFFLGLLSLIISGVTGEGLLFLLTFVILLAILTTPRATLFGGLLSILTIAIVSAGMILGLIPAPTGNNISSSTSLSTWLIDGTIFIFLAAISAYIVRSLLHDLINAMSSQQQTVDELEHEHRNLENLVSERASQLEKRARQVEIASQIAREIVSQKDADVLLETTVNRIKESFGFYHAGIFLIDERKEYAVLKAATGEAGKEMLARNHRLKIGEEGIVGSVVEKGEAHIALDVGEDAIHFKNPLLPSTRSEMALPLSAGEEIIGALDIQSEEEAAFSQEDINVLSTVANQLAVALERSKLINQLHESRAELEIGYQQNAQQAWQSYFKKIQGAMAFQYSNQGLSQNITMPPESLQALMSGKSVIQPVLHPENGEEKHSTVLAIPIRLRNQVLGVLNINLEESASPEDLLTLGEAVSSRLALALENARLLEQLQDRAEQEHLVGDITAKLRSATDVSEILKTTAVELGRSLGVNEVRVQLLTTKED